MAALDSNEDDCRTLPAHLAAASDVPVKCSHAAVLLQLSLPLTHK